MCIAHVCTIVNIWCITHIPFLVSRFGVWCTHLIKLQIFGALSFFCFYIWCIYLL